MTGMSLLDVLRGVMLDPAEQAVYEADPGAYLQQHGYEDVDPADLSEAFGLVADTLPAEQAVVAYTGAEVAGVSSIGADTTDFDEPAAVPDEGGLVDDLGVDGEPDDMDDTDHVDDSDDVVEIEGNFGEGEDAGGVGEPIDVASFSWGSSQMGTFGHDADDVGDLAAAGEDATDVAGDVTVSDIGGVDVSADDDPGAGHLHGHDADAAGTGADGDAAADIGDDPDELDIGSF
jgi:hypothetical protein